MNGLEVGFVDNGGPLRPLSGNAVYCPLRGTLSLRAAFQKLRAGVQVVHNLTLPVDETPDAGLTQSERGSYEQP